MIISFTLTMPGCPSWNGRWSQEDQLHVMCRVFRETSKNCEMLAPLLKKKFFSYQWDDGWRACVEVQQVGRGEAQKLRKQSCGFAGYDWMIDSILKHGIIITESDLAQKQVVGTAAIDPYPEAP